MQLKSSVLYKVAALLWWIGMNLVLFTSPKVHSENRFLDFPGIDKIFHLVIFAILTWLILKAFQQALTKKNGVFIYTFLVLYAISTELIQSQISGRTGDFYDFLFDVIGICIGWFIYRQKK